MGSEQRLRIRAARILWLPLLALVVIGGALLGWWMVGDLTETGVTHPNYMLRAPEWATRHSGLLGALGCVLVAFGLLAFNLELRLASLVWSRGGLLAAQVALVLDGLFIGFVLRSATVGSQGASFGGVGHHLPGSTRGDEHGWNSRLGETDVSMVISTVANLAEVSIPYLDTRPGTLRD